MKISTPATLPPRVQARLSSYATLAGAALAAPALVSSARAAIVYSGPVSVAIPVTTAGVYLNVITGVSGATPASAPGWDLNAWGTGNLFLYGPTAGTYGVIQNFTGGSSTVLADNLPVGTAVNGTYSVGNVAVESTGATLFNLSSTANYAGFSFLNETTGAVNYGWVRFSLSTAYNVAPRSIVSYAYENTGAAIAVGAVPEPATTTTALLGALAAGAVGVRRWRRSKAA